MKSIQDKLASNNLAVVAEPHFANRLNSIDNEIVMNPHEQAMFYFPLVKQYAEKLGSLCRQASTTQFNFG